MDYRRIYTQLIERAQHRARPECYTERHHILPRCMGGSNTKSNLTRLTAREHLLAHRILEKIYPGNQKIFLALWIMLIGRRADMPRIKNSREYERVRIQVGNHMSKIQTGSKRPPRTLEHSANASAAQMGKILSEETKDKIREARKLQAPWSDEQRLNQSKRGTGPGNNFYGKKHSAESKAKISEHTASSKKVSCDGVIYNSMADAATVYGFKLYVTVKKRCLSDKWPSWYLVA